MGTVYFVLGSRIVVAGSHILKPSVSFQCNRWIACAVTSTVTQTTTWPRKMDQSPTIPYSLRIGSLKVIAQMCYHHPWMTVLQAAKNYSKFTDVVLQ